MISIIIPIYNAEKYLSSCLESCLTQTYTQFEIIAVNDGSTDNSLNILTDYAQRDKRIKIINKKNEGLVNARISGLEKANGEFVFFLDSDDMITRDALDLLWAKFTEGNEDIIVGQIAVVLESGKLIAKKENKIIDNSIIKSILLKEFTPSLCGRLYRKSLFDGIILPQGYTTGEDVISNLIICKAKSPSVALLNVAVLNYIQHRESMVNVHTQANADRRMKYLEWVSNYVTTLTNPQNYNTAIARFFTEEFFSFLRDGGQINYNRDVDRKVMTEYIYNKQALSTIPLSRVMMIKAFKLNNLAGIIYRFCFVTVRSMFR
ncbi:MAG: glycosyltransferase family 2 protein [Mucinivorans sp.]